MGLPRGLEPAAARVEELATLEGVYRKHRAEYAAAPEEAEKLLAVGLKEFSTESPEELAAWVSVGRVILNLSETITRY